MDSERMSLNDMSKPDDIQVGNDNVRLVDTLPYVCNCDKEIRCLKDRNSIMKEMNTKCMKQLESIKEEIILLKQKQQKQKDINKFFTDAFVKILDFNEQAEARLQKESKIKKVSKYNYVSKSFFWYLGPQA